MQGSSWCRPLQITTRHWFASDQSLSLQSQPSCGIYQYCKVEISNNIYSSFQVSRSFKKGPLPNNGFGTLNSPGITAVPPTRKKPGSWSLGSSQHYFSLCLRLYVHQREYIPETWLSEYTVQQQFTSNTELFSIHRTRPLFGMMPIKNNTQPSMKYAIKYQTI